MSRKAYEIEFALNAKVGSNFGGSFSKAKEQISSIQKEIASLSRTQSDISAYQKQQVALEQTQDKLALLKQEYDNIQREIQETEGYSSSLENKLLNKEAQIQKTSAKVKEYSENLDKMGAELREAGVNTDNLTQESGELSNKISNLKSKQVEAGESAKKMGGATVDAFQEMQEALVAAGIIKAVKEMAEAFVDCSKASIEFESAVTGVFKTVDGTDEQLSEITEGIKEMSTQIPATTTEISGVAEAAGQLGIARQDVLDFTRVMIDLGESTNLTADEAASSFAKFANITGTAAENYSRLGSVVVDLGNNLATTEADIVAMSTRLASAGTLAGLTEAEIMALAAAMSSVGIEAEAGGTAMTQTLSKIEMAVASGGDSLEGFAKVAGMSALEFANAWENNAIGAVQSFIAGVGSLEDKGESAVLVLDELGLTGVRQSNMIKSLGLAAETLGQSIGIATNAWEENNALTIEAGKRYATTESQIAMLGNKFNNLKVAVGDVYAPSLREAIDLGGDMVEGITKFVKENPAAVKAIGALATGTATFTVALGGYIAVTKAAKVAQTALNAAMNANPYLLVTTAIIGATVALGTFVATLNDSSEELTASSKAQKDELDALKREYDTFSDAEKKTNSEALELRYEIEKLSAEYENNSQTVRELYEEHETLNKKLDESHNIFRNSLEAIDEEETSALSLINKLDELTSSSESLTSSQGEIQSIINSLNGSVEGLNLNYNDLIQNQEYAISGAKKAAKAYFDKKEYERADERYSQAVVDYENAVKVRDKLKKQYEETYEEYWKNTGWWWQNIPIAIDLMPESITGEADVDKAYAAYIEAEENVTQASNDMAAAKAIVNDYFYEEVDAVNNAAAAMQSLPASAEEVNAFFEKAATSLEELITAYDEAYEAAYSSLSGQYSLWDQAAQVSAVKTQTITDNIEDQTKYWQDYRENLETLTDKALEIEGLDAVIASFADGSEEAVNTVAGLVKATDEELEKFVKSWNELEVEKNTISELIADFQIDLEEGLENLQATTEQGIEELNLDTEAANAAKETFGAYVAEIDAQTVSAAIAVGKFKNAIDSALTGNSPTPTTPDIELPPINNSPLWIIPSWHTTSNGYATGTEHASPGLHWVGENGPELLDFAGGEKVMSAEESAAFKNNIQTVALLSPALMAMATYGERAVQSMTLIDKPRSSPVSISVTFQIDGNASSDTVSQLESFGTEFAERVLEVLDEAGIDTLRRSYN